MLTLPLRALITPCSTQPLRSYFRAGFRFQVTLGSLQIMEKNLPDALHPKYHNYLIESQDRRNIGDYSLVAEVTEEQTREMLGWAEEFITATEEYLM